ncbi:hypothetical protein GGTG_10318 [Gaeumannomyces tritici R3-111a-1]|uniref:Uncharacterized protein n=1 Tax=Gaeumannomyces tritici (strain R3-111a-1) TaxID=644352 RepID=J3P9Z4_GAET3|nr:hypothetical protein GGTG_10318 [Gaeumannomyces tritici R3-111a-1]EJT73480.1 hypothetical protein GGTG_10318 [Gaeumannomyces tritici R3-111a-1]
MRSGWALGNMQGTGGSIPIATKRAAQLAQRRVGPRLVCGVCLVRRDRDGCASSSRRARLQCALQEKPACVAPPSNRFVISHELIYGRSRGRPGDVQPLFGSSWPCSAQLPAALLLEVPLSCSSAPPATLYNKIDKTAAQPP